MPPMAAGPPIEAAPAASAAGDHPPHQPPIQAPIQAPPPGTPVAAALAGRATAYPVTGAPVRRAVAAGGDLAALNLSELKSVLPDMKRDVYDVPGVKNTAASRMSYGGTRPPDRPQIARWKDELK